ncbi:MAG: hypothetical protein ABJA66_00235 [Actinomycetota bacterium]
MFINLGFEEFEKLVNTKFSVNGFENVELELFEVTDRKVTPQQEMFSLLFRGSKDHFLEQRIYDLSNEQFSSAEIFLVPIGQNDEVFTYQAVFNRLLKS